jgi:hypothetical protein
MTTNFDSKIFGVADTFKALRQADPIMSKQLTKEMKKPGMEIARKARTFVDPEGLSGWGEWRGGYDAKVIKRGITASVTSGRSRKRGNAVLRVLNKSAAGSIWELAGRQTNGAPPRPGINAKTGWTYGNGVGFVDAIRRKSGKKASRLIWHAWDQTDQAGAQQAVRDAVATAEKELQERLDQINASLAKTAPGLKLGGL